MPHERGEGSSGNSWVLRGSSLFGALIVNVRLPSTGCRGDAENYEDLGWRCPLAL